MIDWDSVLGCPAEGGPVDIAVLLLGSMEDDGLDCFGFCSIAFEVCCMLVLGVYCRLSTTVQVVSSYSDGDLL